MKDPQEMWFPFQDAFKYYDTLKNYNPVTNWQRFFNPQFFITYNAEDVAGRKPCARQKSAAMESNSERL